MEIKTQQTTQGEKIIFIDGKDRYTTYSKVRAIEVFDNWLVRNERLPKPFAKGIGFKI